MAKGRRTIKTVEVTASLREFSAAAGVAVKLAEAPYVGDVNYKLALFRRKMSELLGDEHGIEFLRTKLLKEYAVKGENEYTFDTDKDRRAFVGGMAQILDVVETARIPKFEDGEIESLNVPLTGDEVVALWTVLESEAPKSEE